MQSTRAKVVARRTYNRPITDTEFETWAQTIDRVIQHQHWLWKRAKGRDIGVHAEAELEELRLLMLARKVAPSGRTLWLGGTDVAKRREASQFNCSFLKLETVHDMVDAMWLLLQGCGVGARPVAGTLNGFAKPIAELEIIRSTRDGRGAEENVETFEDGIWTIRLGDSAESWAKGLGKLLGSKYPANKLVFDCSEIRPSGTRLKGYGWISSGDQAVVQCVDALFQLLNRKSGQLLSRHDIHDCFNWFGTILSSRRSAEIVLYDYGTPGWQEFATFKKDFWLHGNDHRQQSNNSLLFWQQPSAADIEEVLRIMHESGGSEPGIYNAGTATKRAPWFSGTNPCGEILLSNKSFCNLVETNIAAFAGDPASLHRAHQLVARANYRQTCVDLRDGILQSAWHENNEFLRLCGVGITGIAGRPDFTPYDYRQLRNSAVIGAYSMADELGLPRPKAVTTIKPSGTMSKIMDAPGEGAHKPLGKYIFNNVKFSSHDPIVEKLVEAGYNVIESPTETDKDTVLITFPVENTGVKFDVVDGKEVNLEPALVQLDRYKMLMDNYVDHNCSITISYSEAELPEISSWLDKNWDHYVGVSFIPRIDPTKTAADLGYPYLPQEVVDKETYDAYVEKIGPIDIDTQGAGDLLDEDCVGGVCPVR
jgi:adenosylcobalamin-dependent ribonucleoside-triphosphate reductase